MKQDIIEMINGIEDERILAIIHVYLKKIKKTS